MNVYGVRIPFYYTTISLTSEVYYFIVLPRKCLLENNVRTNYGCMSNSNMSYHRCPRSALVDQYNLNDYWSATRIVINNH